jgi:hypothetical protein
VSTTYAVNGRPTTVDDFASTLVAVQNTGAVPLLIEPLGRTVDVGATVTVPGWSTRRTRVRTAGQNGTAVVTLTAGSPAAAPGPGGVTFDPGPASAMSITVTGGTWYSNEGLTTAVSFPVSITAATVLYPAAAGSITITAVVGGTTQLRGMNVNEGSAEAFVWTPSTDAERAAAGVSAGSSTYVPKLTGIATTADVTAVAGNNYRCTPLARTVTDGVTTAGSSSVTSATAAFTNADTGSFLVGSHIPALSTLTYTGATSATITYMASLTQTGRTWTIVKPLTVTLPTGAAKDVLAVSKADGLLASITIAAPGGGTVNGVSAVTLSAPTGSVTLTCSAAGVWLATGDVDNRTFGPTVFRSFPIIRALDTHTGNLDTQLVAKPYGSGDVSPWEAWHDDIQADIVHFNCGPGMVGNADAAQLFGLGCDYEGTGIYLHVRATGGGGKGMRIGMDQGLTYASAVGLEISNGSGTGTGAKFIQSPATTAAGPAAVFWAQIAPDSTQKLVKWQKPNTLSAGTDVGFVRAVDGYFFWNAPINVTSDVIAAVPLQVTGINGQTGDLARFDVSGSGTLAKVDSGGVVTGTSMISQGASTSITVYNTGGTVNQRRYRFTDSSGYLAIQSRVDNGGSNKDLLLLHNTSQNVGIAGSTQFGAGTGGCIAIPNATADPSTNPTSAGVLYVSGGALKFRGSSGTVTTIAAA